MEVDGAYIRPSSGGSFPFTKPSIFCRSGGTSVMLKITAFRSNILWELWVLWSMCFCNSSNLSECATSKVKDLPDHVNESKIHFSTIIWLPPATTPWCSKVRMERGASFYIHYRSCHSGDRTDAGGHDLRNSRNGPLKTPIFVHSVCNRGNKGTRIK